MRKNLSMKQEDKDVIIKELNQELNYFKNFSRDVRIQLDKKVAVLAYALESQRNYHSLKQEVIKSFSFFDGSDDSIVKYIINLSQIMFQWQYIIMGISIRIDFKKLSGLAFRYKKICD